MSVTRAASITASVAAHAVAPRAAYILESTSVHYLTSVCSYKILVSEDAVAIV